MKFISIATRQLALVASGQSRQRETALNKDSTALRVLYELVVPRWPLIHWVAFRMVMDVQADRFGSFLDLLHGPDRDLFAWDDKDDAKICQLLLKDDARLELYSQDWEQYMVELDLQVWQQINSMTRIATRNRRGFEQCDMRIRLTAMLLKYSSTLGTFPVIAYRRDFLRPSGTFLSSARRILAPLQSISIFDDLSFAIMASVVEQHHKELSTPADFESAEFWATPHLWNWLSNRQETLCHTIWRTSPQLSVLSRVQIMELVLNTALPQVSSSPVSSGSSGLISQTLQMYACLLALQRYGCDG